MPRVRKLGNPFGKVLWDARLKKGWSRADVLCKLRELYGEEMDPSSLVAIEAGRVTLRAERFLALCEIYELDPVEVGKKCCPQKEN